MTEKTNNKMQTWIISYTADCVHEIEAETEKEAWDIAELEKHKAEIVEIQVAFVDPK